MVGVASTVMLKYTEAAYAVFACCAKPAWAIGPAWAKLSQSKLLRSHMAQNTN